MDRIVNIVTNCVAGIKNVRGSKLKLSKIPPEAKSILTEIPKDFEEFKKTFMDEKGRLTGTSRIMPDGKEPIRIRGFHRGTVIDYPHPGVHKWQANYGRVFKTYKSFEDALRGVFEDLTASLKEAKSPKEVKTETNLRTKRR